MFATNRSMEMGEMKDEDLAIRVHQKSHIEMSIEYWARRTWFSDFSNFESNCWGGLWGSVRVQSGFVGFSWNSFLHEMWFTLIVCANFHRNRSLLNVLSWYHFAECTYIISYLWIHNVNIYEHTYIYYVRIHDFILNGFIYDVVTNTVHIHSRAILSSFVRIWLSHHIRIQWIATVLIELCSRLR